MGKFGINSTPKEVSIQLAENCKNARKELKLTRKELANNSGVSFASLKRFEETGQIALVSALMLLETLGLLEKAKELFVVDTKDDFTSKFDF